MNRRLSVLLLLLISSAGFAAPAPEQFLSGWDKLVIPDRSCKVTRPHGALIIEMPGTYYDYDPLRNRCNAPRLLRDIEGNFDLQVRVQFDAHPSRQSAVKGQASFVSAGFLILLPKNYTLNTYAPTYIRFEYGISPEGIGVDGYAALKTLDQKEREDTEIWVGEEGRTAMKTVRRQGEHIKEFWDRFNSKWPMPKKTDHVFLRLEQRDIWLNFFISWDGDTWTRLTSYSGHALKFKLGLAGYSRSADTSKVRFDRLKLARGKKKKRKEQRAGLLDIQDR